MRPFTRSQLYWLLQESVLAGRRGLAAEEHLRRLNEAFRPIFDAFQDSTVVVNYGAPGAVEAYRLHYWTHYAYVAYRSVAGLSKSIFERARRDRLAYTAVAPGPFPEIIGVVEAAALHGVEHGRIDVTLVDIAVDTWRFAAEQSVAIARRLSPGMEIHLRFETADLRQPFTDRLPQADLVTMQNCLNEFCHDGVPSAAVLQCAESVRKGGGLAVSDLGKYGPVQRAIGALKNLLSQRQFRAVAVFDPNFTDVTPFGHVPRDTFYHFYRVRRSSEDAPWERDYPTKKYLNFSWSTWEKE